MTPNQVYPAGGIKTVYIADDDGMDLHFMRNAVKQANPMLRIETFSDSKDLFSMLAFLLPDLLFLDLELPCHQGMQCILELRSHQRWKDLPVVVFSSSSRHANITAAYELGADLFFIRPFDQHTLVERLKALLSLNWNSPGAIKQSFAAQGNLYNAFV
jgi:DNA-binding response OmpR family regulator